MCFKLTVLALTCLGCLTAQPVHFRANSQVPNAESSDLEPAETKREDPHAAIQAGSKFFQDIYVAMEKPNELQFGHVAENPNNWEQRFEKINLGNLQRQGKVRWGDKDGGYGEHYYDYNHDGQQQGGEGKQTQHQPRYVTYGQQAGQESVLTPDYAAQRGKREQGLLKDVEFISDKARSLILDGNTQKHGGNYRRADDYRGKREQHAGNDEDPFESDKGSYLDGRGDEYE